MQKRPRETYKIPVKSRSAQSECVLRTAEKETKTDRKKISHNKTARNESKSQEDDVELSNVDHKTKLVNQPNKVRRKR